MFDVLALGEILIDFTPNGTNEQGMALFSRNPGGAPANVLAMVARLGGKTAFIGKVGRDEFGSFLRQTLQENSINIEGLMEDQNIPTTLAVVQLDQRGERSFTFYRKPGADMRLTWDEVRKNLIGQCKIFHFGSVSMTDEPCHEATIKAAEEARKNGCIISFDPNYRPKLWRCEKEALKAIKQGVTLADILKVSEDELQFLTNETDIKRGSKQLLNQGPSIVLVSLGEKGAFYRNSAGYGLIPAFNVKAIDATGAGDAFLGAVRYSLCGSEKDNLATMPKERLKQIVAFANAAGGLTTTRRGAIPAMPSVEEIKSWVDSNRA